MWTLDTGATNGHEAPPLVNDGIMFVATPGNQVIALEAVSGRVLWRYKRPLPEDVVLMHPTTRGVALYDDKVFLAANEAVLVALDARTGREVWTTAVEDNKNGYYMSMAPLVVDGKVMAGVSGGEFGVRGFVAAFDASTGKQLWRTYAVPAPGEPGSETWPKGDKWQNGGGPVWVTGNYDPETNLSFWGTGNGGPWMGDQRPGDLHRIDARHRRVERGDQGTLSISSERLVGLGRGVAPAADRLRARRTEDQRVDQRRPRRLPVVPRAKR